MGCFFDPRQLPLVEVVPVLRVETDGIVDHVNIVAHDFEMTYYRVMTAVGSIEPVRAPVLIVRRPLVSYVPSYLGSLVMEAQKRIENGRPMITGEVAVH